MWKKTIFVIKIRIFQKDKIVNEKERMRRTQFTILYVELSERVDVITESNLRWNPNVVRPIIYKITKYCMLFPERLAQRNVEYSQTIAIDRQKQCMQKLWIHIYIDIYIYIYYFSYRNYKFLKSRLFFLLFI